MSETASALALRARIDRGADVLYVTGRPGVPARSREEEPGLVWRYASDTGELVGLTIGFQGGCGEGTGRRGERLEVCLPRAHAMMCEPGDLSSLIDDAKCYALVRLHRWLEVMR